MKIKGNVERQRLDKEIKKKKFKKKEKVRLVKDYEM